MDTQLCTICSSKEFLRISDKFMSNIFFDIMGSQLPQGSCLCWLCRYQLIKLRNFKQLCLHSINCLLALEDHGNLNGKSSFGKTITNNFSACSTCLDNNYIENDGHNNDYKNIVIFPSHISEDLNYKEDRFSPNGLDYISDDDEERADEERRERASDFYDETKNKLEEDGSYCDEPSYQFDNSSSTETQNNYKDQEFTESEPQFEKIILSVEEQKSELESMRKDVKYINSVYKCYTCALGFGFKDSYQSHMVRHEESNGEYSCPVCTLRFAQSSVRSMHVALHRERHRCLRCGLVVKRDRRRQHAARCGGGEGAGCHRCGKMFPDTRCLQQHLRRMHGASRQRTDKHRCTVCSNTYANASNLRAHMIAHANTLYNCAQCESVFRSPYALNRHTKLHTDNTQHYCQMCDAWFKTRKTFATHLKTASAHTTDVYECDVCGRACPNRQSLAAHAESHTAPEHACDTCDATYTTRKSLLRHAKTHRRSRDAGRVICHLCGKSYKGKSKLRRHLIEVCEVKSNDLETGE